MEPRIIPLVDALNATGILDTFSSCEGHFLIYDDGREDSRDCADVRFFAHGAVSNDEMESFLNFLATEFNGRHSFSSILILLLKITLGYTTRRNSTFNPIQVQRLVVKYGS